MAKTHISKDDLTEIAVKAQAFGRTRRSASLGRLNSHHLEHATVAWGEHCAAPGELVGNAIRRLAKTDAVMLALLDAYDALLTAEKDLPLVKRAALAETAERDLDLLSKAKRKKPKAKPINLDVEGEDGTVAEKPVDFGIEKEPEDEAKSRREQRGRKPKAKKSEDREKLLAALEREAEASRREGESMESAFARLTREDRDFAADVNLHIQSADTNVSAPIADGGGEPSGD